MNGSVSWSSNWNNLLRYIHLKTELKRNFIYLKQIANVHIVLSNWGTITNWQRDESFFIQSIKCFVTTFKMDQAKISQVSSHIVLRSNRSA